MLIGIAGFIGRHELELGFAPYLCGLVVGVSQYLMMQLSRAHTGAHIAWVKRLCAQLTALGREKLPAYLTALEALVGQHQADTTTMGLDDNHYWGYVTTPLMKPSTSPTVALLMN